MHSLTRRPRSLVRPTTEGSFAIVGTSDALMPLQIIIVDLLMPIGMSAALLLLLRFIRDSSNRRMSKREEVQRRRRKNSSSVAPSSSSSAAPSSGIISFSRRPTQDLTNDLSHLKSTSRAGTAAGTSGRPVMMVIQPSGGHGPPW